MQFMSTDPMIVEEETSLTAAKQHILEAPQPVQTSEEDLVQQILTLRDEINTAKAEDIPALSDQMSREMAILENLRNTPKKQSTSPKNPYFGHVLLGGRLLLKHL